MRKLLIILVLSALTQFLFAQQTLPVVTVKIINKNILIVWRHSYSSVRAINIQRSFNSTKNFKTIASIPYGKKVYEYADVNPPSQHMFYRLFISFDGGKYLYTPAVTVHDAMKIISLENKKPTVINNVTTDTSNRKTFIADSNKIIQLKEVKVLTKKPVIEQDIDKLTYHADADPESKVMTALDILRKVPMVTVDAEDNIMVNGSGNYQVLINGKTSSLFLRNPSDIFKGMPASIIKDIEIITNPPAKYQAAGVGGIINIITYKKNISGYNGSMNIAASSPKGFTGTGYFTAKPGRLSVSTFFGNIHNTNPVSTNNFLRQDKVRHNTLQQTGESNSDNNSYNAGVELNYELDSFNTVTGSYNFNSGRATNNFRQLAQLFTTPSNIIEEYSYLNSAVNKWSSNDIGVSYQRNFKNNSSQLFSLSYNLNTNSGSGPSDFIRRFKNNRSLESNTDNNNLTKENILQADYILPIKKYTIETGIKLVFGNNISDYFYRNQDSTGIFKLDSAQSDNFEYSQNMHAAYVSVGYKKNKVGIKIGARAEETVVNAKFKTTGTVAQQHYYNIIPNIILSQRLKGTGTIRLSYTQRIERPMLNYLNPYVYLIDPKNISYGNPKLTASVSNVFNLAYNTFVKSTSINANVFYNFTNNSIQQFTFLSADTISRTTYGNIAANKNFGISLSGNTTFFKKLNVNVNANSSYINFTSRYISRPRKGFVLNVSGFGNYSFAKGWRASGNIGYSTASILLQGTSAGYVWNSISVFKDFLQDNRTTFSFSATSPFSKNKHLFTELTDAAFYQLQESHFVIRRYTLSFNYRFAKVQGGSVEKK
ncbi:MAG: TonB-dependent receptor [Bacteroidota bacterium]|nr:TonB-dependent receptor [Bacteroidota bacterium]